MKVFSGTSIEAGELVGVTVGSGTPDHKITRAVLLEKGTAYKQINSQNVRRVISEERHHWGDTEGAQIRAASAIENWADGKGKPWNSPQAATSASASAVVEKTTDRQR